MYEDSAAHLNSSLMISGTSPSFSTWRLSSGLLTENQSTVPLTQTELDEEFRPTWSHWPGNKYAYLNGTGDFKGTRHDSHWGGKEGFCCPRWWKSCTPQLEPKVAQTQQSNQQGLLGDPGWNLHLDALQRDASRQGHLLIMCSALCFTRQRNEVWWDPLRTPTTAGSGDNGYKVCKKEGQR